MKTFAALLLAMVLCSGCIARSLFTLSPVVIILPGGKQVVAITNNERYDNRRAEAMPPPELDEAEEAPEPAKPQSWRPLL